MDYSSFVNASADLLILLPTITNAASATPSSDPNFNVILPRAIEYAEQRMYRELDLMQTFETQTATTVSGTRSVNVPTGMIVMNSLYVITPAGAGKDDAGASRNLVQRVTVDALNMFWPAGQVSQVAPSIPRYFSSQSDTAVALAPCPDASYTLEFYGTFRPTPLSASNTTTILTTYLPDVFLACAMVFFAGYQRDFGMQSDDPKMAVSWEAQYQTLKTSASEEISRAKSQGSLWAPFSSPKLATATTRGQ